MALMIPSTGPREHDLSSQEGRLYDALSRLPDDYYVVHSLDAVSNRSRYAEREIDFVVFHPDLGILCIESKAGQAYYSDGYWHRSNGERMEKYGGPYGQAKTAMRHLMDCFDEHGMTSVKQRCKFMYAVWFPSLGRRDLAHVSLPLDSPLEQTMFFEDLSDPEPAIRRIMALDSVRVRTDLSQSDSRAIVRKVLCPEFHVVPTARMQYDFTDMVFSRLLDSQARVLDFIRDQRFAVINGAAGTGKTLIAIERARRAARDGRVLFLCYNALLRDDIARRLSDEPNIFVATIAQFACKVIGTPSPNYKALGEELTRCYVEEDFAYDHVIVDEGQDFGVKAIEDAEILKTLNEIVTQRRGTFYLFYDHRQFVQGSEMPKFINEADCKLTLYVNCRNTKSIATCSLCSIGDAKGVEVLEGAQTSGPPELFVSPDRGEQARFVDAQIKSLRDKGLDDIVILTCKTEEGSALWDYVHERTHTWRNTNARFTTFRKFKGLEADAVILVDVDESLWREPVHDFDPKPGLSFYTAASRAKYELRIVCDMDEAGCSASLARLGVERRRKPISRFAKQLGAVIASVDF